VKWPKRGSFSYNNEKSALFAQRKIKSPQMRCFWRHECFPIKNSDATCRVANTVFAGNAVSGA